MPIIVQKYGGSSVADIDRIRAVADKVVAAKRAGNDVVVVVSAMGKTTDGLLRLAKDASGEGAEPPRRELDMLVSTGERVSMALLSIAIAARGELAISFTGSQSGILTNDRHFDARILEVRPHRIEDELVRGKIVIVAGYQGMSYKREITTLGRGGSDTTAVALAAALEAERCEIYSDVDGVFSGDPRIVTDAVHFSLMGLQTLQEMAEAGAKVLNAQAVEWARRAKIKIFARRTSDPWEDPGAAPRQTIAEELAEGSNVRAVVGLERVAYVRLPLEAAAEWFAQTADCALPLLDVHVGTSELSCVIPLLNVPDWPIVREKLAAMWRRGTLEETSSLVSVVGDGLTARAGLIPRFIDALKNAHVETLVLSATPLRISAVIPRPRVQIAQQAMHEAFVKSDQ